MDSGTINLSTGPVEITCAVRDALASSPIAHRSDKFRSLYYDTTSLLKAEFKIDQVYILTGSGTLANEAMLHQLKETAGQGLILSNGEFGERLIDQAGRISLDFIPYRQQWGSAFDLYKIGQIMQQHLISWIVFVHCETSTGVINDLNKLTELAEKHKSACYVDCMSTLGTQPLDLSGITMATASSGKGLASIPGLALVFSNIEPQPTKELPSYLDLGTYHEKSGIPFTLSSNLLAALNVSIRQKLNGQQYSLLETYRKEIFNLVHKTGLCPFASETSSVFTIVPGDRYEIMLREFRENNLVISYESEYLRTRKWLQIALFNYYSEAELETLLTRLENILTPKIGAAKIKLAPKPDLKI